MNERRFERVESEREGAALAGLWEARVAELAQTFPYPDTPDLAVLPGAGAKDLQRRWTRAVRPAWATALLVLVVALTLLAVPQVRAAVVRVFQLGVVRIFMSEPATPVIPSGDVSLTPQPGSTPEPALAQIPVTATPFIGPPPTALPGVGETVTEAPPPVETGLPPSLTGLAGQTTLDEARRRVPFPVTLPAYPADLDEPDYVFVQEHAGPVLILAWSDPQAKGGVGLSLWVFRKGTAIDKFDPKTVTETTVNGGRALWTQGEHMLYLPNADIEAPRLVLGNTLIWERQGTTFRLETFLPLEEAVKVAESVR